MVIYRNKFNRLFKENKIRKLLNNSSYITDKNFLISSTKINFELCIITLVNLSLKATIK